MYIVVYMNNQKIYLEEIIIRYVGRVDKLASCIFEKLLSAAFFKIFYS